MESFSGETEEGTEDVLGEFISPVVPDKSSPSKATQEFPAEIKIIDVETTEMTADTQTGSSWAVVTRICLCLNVCHTLRKKST